MAEDKKSFILYKDLIHTVRKMPKDKIAHLFLTILEYVNDEEPVVDDMMVDLVFEPIKQQLKRDLGKWEGTKEEKSNSGKLGNLKRWNNDLYKKVVNKELTLEQAEVIANGRTAIKSIAPVANVAVNVNDNVTVNVNESAIEDAPSPCIDLTKSNLYRQPNIPTMIAVWEFFSGQGATKEMARSFWDKQEGKGWFIDNSPIKDWTAVARRFIDSWQKNDIKRKKEEPQSTSAPLKYAS